MLEPGNSRLKTSIVVSSHLILFKILSAIHVLVILARASDQRAVQSLRIRTWVVKVIPSAGGWCERTRTAAMMWSLGRIRTEAHHETASAITQHVMNLLFCKLTELGRFDSLISGNQCQEGCVGRVAVWAPLISPRKAFWGVMDLVTREPACYERVHSLFV